MRKYKLAVVTGFTDKNTSKKYKKNDILENVEEERAFELFSSEHHLVKYVSFEEDENKNALVDENKTLKEEKEKLEEEIKSLKIKIEELQPSNNEDESQQEEEQDKKTKK